MAAFFTHQTYFAEVADVSVDSQNRITVHQVWAAGDVGSQVINPRAAENLTYGGIIDGISQMEQEITLLKGAVEQTNFTRQPMLRMRQAPNIKVQSARRSIRQQALANPCCRPHSRPLPMPSLQQPENESALCLSSAVDYRSLKTQWRRCNAKAQIRKRP